ncbi:MAG: glycerophosphodiester phosphodiesterase [Sphaerochaeta sp.]|nr:glycerophosphodiester phosphodiesterase [Sphaerochaeta sp.]
MNTHLLITAHSGALGTQGNSMEYLIQACLAQPDFIEIDLRKTLDGKVVLSHDPCLAGCSLSIAEMMYEDMVLHEPSLLLLEDAFDICFAHDVKVNLDIKEYEVVAPACAVIEARQCSSQVLFSGCREHEIFLVRQLLPFAKVLYNAHPWDRQTYPVYRAYAQAMIETAQESDAFGLNISCEYVQEELFGLARKEMLPIFVWTVESRAQMRMMIAYGAASLTTKNVPLLKEELACLEEELSEMVCLDPHA